MKMSSNVNNITVMLKHYCNINIILHIYIYINVKKRNVVMLLPLRFLPYLALKPSNVEALQ